MIFNSFDLKSYVNNRRDLVDKALDSLLPDGDLPYLKKILDPMRYSLFAGGKRLRPILCIAGSEAVGGTAQHVLPIACALELIHTYSLIHDDLPSMDNDTLRRGVPTNHVIYGEGMAILAGDGLLTEAFQILSHPETVMRFQPERLLRVINIISSASGYRGMVGGQAIDLLSEGKDVDLDTVRFIHGHKTGALIQASVVSGAIVCGATEEEIGHLARFGRLCGLAFQIWDDVLDLEGDPETMGKEAMSDEKSAKATYPKVLGLERSKEEAQNLVKEAIQSLSIFGTEADPLRAIALYMVERRS